MPEDPIQLSAPEPSPATGLDPGVEEPATGVEQEQLLNTCPECHGVIDVTEIRPYEKIICPLCNETIRVRTIFDHFTLQSEIGEGGMSRVFRAHDDKLGREVALKILHSEFFTNPEMTAQFEREARVTASINHPHVVQVYKVGSDQGYYYIAMELLDSVNLEERITRNGAYPEKEAMRLLHETALGLAAAHAAGLLHRDIKPGNVLLDSNGTAKLTDFGLALMHGQDDTMADMWATPFYVPPEKLVGYPEDLRSDIYSLGAAFFHAMAGTPPFNAPTASVDALIALKAHTSDLGAMPVKLRGSTVDLINTMMAYDPAQRPQSYPQLLAMIERARAQADPDFSSEGRGRGPVFWITVVGGVLAIVGSIIGVMAFVLGGPKDDPLVIGGSKGGGTNGGGSGGEFVVSAEQLALVELRKNAEADFAAKNFGESATKLQQLLGNPNATGEAKAWAHFQLGAIDLIKGDEPGSLEDFARCRELLGQVRESDRAALDRVTNHLVSATAAPIGGLADADQGGLYAFGTLLYGLKNWKLAEFSNCGKFFNTYGQTEFPEGSWMGGHGDLGKPVLADIKAFEEVPEFDPKAKLPELHAFKTKAEAAAETITVCPTLAEALRDRASKAGSLIAQIEREAMELVAKADGEKVAEAREKAEPLVKQLLLAEAAQVWRDVEPELAGQDAKNRATSLVDALDRTAEFYKYFIENVGQHRYDGQILRTEGKPFSAKILRATGDHLIVDLGFGPTNVELAKISVSGLALIAKKTVMTGQLTPELSEGAAYFNWLAGDHPVAQALADELADQTGFARRWAVMTAPDFE